LAAGGYVKHVWSDPGEERGPQSGGVIGVREVLVNDLDVGYTLLKAAISSAARPVTGVHPTS